MPDADFLQNVHLRPLLGGNADAFCSARAFPSLTNAVEKSFCIAEGKFSELRVRRSYGSTSISPGPWPRSLSAFTRGVQGSIPCAPTIKSKLNQTLTGYIPLSFSPAFSWGNAGEMEDDPRMPGYGLERGEDRPLAAANVRPQELKLTRRRRRRNAAFMSVTAELDTPKFCASDR